MTLPNVSILSIVELICYVPVTILVYYLAYRHGRHALLAFFYLGAACTVRIISDIITLATTGSTSTASVVLSSIGLAPMLLAIAGFIHEFHRHYLIASMAASVARGNLLKRLWIVQLQIHAVTVAATILFVIGGVNSATAATSPSTSASEELNTLQQAQTMREAGTILLLAITVLLIAYTAYVLVRIRSASQGYSSPEDRRQQLNGSRQFRASGAHSLAVATLVASVIMLIRVLYTVIYVFDSSNPSLSPYTGSIAVKVIIIFLVSFAAVVALVIGAWNSKNMNRNMDYGVVVTRGGSGELDEYHNVQSKRAHV